MADSNFKKAITDTQKNKRRDAIFTAAKQLMEEKEYNEISMQQIAQKAGVAKGTVYLYFSTKQEIFLELLVKEFRIWKEEYIFLIKENGTDGLYQGLKKIIDLLKKTIQVISVENDSLTKNLTKEKRMEYRASIKRELLEIEKVTREQIDGFNKGDFLQLFMKMSTWNTGLYYARNLNLVIFETISEEEKINKEELLEELYNNFVLNLIEEIKLKNINEKGGLHDGKEIHAKLE